MRNIFATLTMLLSLTLSVSSQAAEEKLPFIDPSKMEDDKAFEKVMRDLFFQLDHFIYENGDSDPNQRHAWIIAWLTDLHLIGFAATSAAWNTAIAGPDPAASRVGNIAQRAAGSVAWGAARSAIPTTVHLARYYAAWKPARNAVTCASSKGAENTAEKTAEDAARNAAERGESPEAVGRAARVAAFMFFLEHFERIFETSFRAFVQASEQSMVWNPMTNGETYHPFCEQFASLTSYHRFALGLHVFASHFTFPRQALTLMAANNDPIDPNRPFSTLPHESMMGIIHILYVLIIWGPSLVEGSSG